MVDWLHFIVDEQWIPAFRFRDLVIVCGAHEFMQHRDQLMLKDWDGNVYGFEDDAMRPEQV